jgi:cation diffusion facilitator CzcD-associated flavoprotein CzcO
VGFFVAPQLLEKLSGLVKKFIARSIPNETLRAQLTPSYALGCKRILLSNDYYPALCRQNVELVTSGIATVTPEGIRTHDGKERPLDAIILATGFQAAEVVAPFPMLGRGGIDLSTQWQDGAEAYLGTTVSGFPNAFLIVGPNTGLGHNSMILMIESQIQYILSTIQAMQEQQLVSVEVKSEVQRRYNVTIHERLKHTVWSSSCGSWYYTRSGKNTTLWPGFTFEFRLRTRRFSPQDYVLAKRPS